MEEKVEEIIEEPVKEEIKHEYKKEKKSKEKEMIDLLNNKVKELEDKNLRISAEMINTIRRKEEETSRVLKYASEDVFIDLIGVVDNFERALSVKTENQDILNYQKGFEMIYAGLKNVLIKNDVKEIDALGKEFDPNKHQAMMTDHVEGKKNNEVIEVLQKGYIYKDKVIRPAMVKVNQ